MHSDEIVDLESTVDAASLRRSERLSDELKEKIREDASPFRMLTGDRPTGRLHLGHYFGSLRNRVELQNAGVDSWLVIADYQVITDRDAVGEIRDRVYGLVTDYLAIGIDPERAVIFPHSQIPALNELVLPFLSIVTDSELRRNPTVKAELDASGNRLHRIQGQEKVPGASADSWSIVPASAMQAIADKTMQQYSTWLAANRA